MVGILKGRWKEKEKKKKKTLDIVLKKILFGAQRIFSKARRSVSAQIAAFHLHK